MHKNWYDRILFFWTGQFNMCRCPKGRILDRVTGKQCMEYNHCATQRLEEYDFVCGTDGKWWQAKL